MSAALEKAERRLTMGLDKELTVCDTEYMETMTDTLRAAIRDSGLPLLQLARRSGVVRQSLIRFTRGSTSLRLDVADRLAAYFGLELYPAARKRKAATRRRQARKDGGR